MLKVKCFNVHLVAVQGHAGLARHAQNAQEHLQRLHWPEMWIKTVYCLSPTTVPILHLPPIFLLHHILLRLLRLL